MMGHDLKVTELFLEAENLIEHEETFWDGVVREEPYYENYESPVDTPDGDKGRCIGEFDVLLYNLDKQIGLYYEVKPHRGEFNYAEEQINRADEFFDDWDIYGQKVVHRR